MAFVRVANLEQLPAGSALKVDVDGRPIALFNVDGEIYAIDDTCSHARASLSEGYIDGDVVECPKHGARFDIKTGRALTLPAVRPVAAYDVQVDGEDIAIDVS